MTRLLDDWERCFPGCDPVGHHLCANFPERWMRFHSLPESKRYPDNEAEHAEVLVRHNAILGDLVHPGEQIVLVTMGYSQSPEPVRTYAEVAAFDPLASPWRTVPMHESEEWFDEPNYWHLYASTWAWKPGTFDPLIRWVAEDAVSNVLVVASDCRWVLHPYDGGMDVIVASPQVRSSLRTKHEPWLSSRADGL